MIRWGAAGTAAAALILAGCSSSSSSAPTPSKKKPAVTSTTTSTTVPVVNCPLTGTPAPGGKIPQRPALAVKVDNYPDARPQSGLDKTDIIFEEPVEGGITRYVAVFQCQDAPLVGPIRSARNIDIGILGEFGKPLLVHVGGIDPVIANIDASPIVDIDLGNHGSVIQTVPGRVAPYATYASTSALWGLEPSSTTPPSPVFSYSTAVPAGSPVASVAIPFSSTSNVVWQYNSKLGIFQRFYGTTPDTLADGVQDAASNVVVQFVQVTYGPWLENDEGGLEVQANLYMNASGPAQIYRNGVEVTGTWQRSALDQPTQFLSSTGTPIALNPGATWVELVPNNITVTPTP